MLGDARVDWVVVLVDLVLYRTVHTEEGVSGLVWVTNRKPA